MLQSYAQPPTNTIHAPTMHLPVELANSQLPSDQPAPYQLFHDLYQQLFLYELETQKRLQLQAISSAWKPQSTPSAFCPPSGTGTCAASTPMRGTVDATKPSSTMEQHQLHSESMDPSAIMTKLTAYMLQQQQQQQQHQVMRKRHPTDPDNGEILMESRDPRQHRSWTSWNEVATRGPYSLTKPSHGFPCSMTNSFYQSGQSMTGQTEMDAGVGLSDTHSSSPTDLSVMETPSGCIDLSLSGQRQRQALSIRTDSTTASRLSFSPIGKQESLGHMDSHMARHHNHQTAYNIHGTSKEDVGELFHLMSSSQNPLSNFNFSSHGSNRSTTTATTSTTPEEAVKPEQPHGESHPAPSTTLNHRERKNRKSGFQAGVTVGYTYDAFFVSDGRSRRRGKGKAKALAATRRVRNRSASGIFSMSSSSSSNTSASSSCAANSSAASHVSSVEMAQWETRSIGKPNMVVSPTTDAIPSISPAAPTTPGSSLLVASTLSSSPDHTTSPRYTCPECGKSYATSSNLSRHKQTHRSLDSQSARKCPHCGKAYVSMPALSMHILTHDLRHRCDLCGKAFSRPWLLQGHRRAHTGEKPYGCAHCGRAFADRSNLRAHMQTHSGMKQYECQHCHKNFALKAYLNKHLESACSERDPQQHDGEVTKEEGEISMEISHQPSTTVAWSVSSLIEEDDALRATKTVR